MAKPVRSAGATEDLFVTREFHQERQWSLLKKNRFSQCPMFRCDTCCDYHWLNIDIQEDCHINYLERITVFIGLLIFSSLYPNFHIVCYSDNTQVVCLFVCGISLTSGQLIIELFPDCTRSCFSEVVLCRRGGDRIYEMRCLFVAVGPNARFIVLPHWDNMS